MINPFVMNSTTQVNMFCSKNEHVQGIPLSCCNSWSFRWPCKINKHCLSVCPEASHDSTQRKKMQKLEHIQIQIFSWPTTSLGFNQKCSQNYAKVHFFAESVHKPLMRVNTEVLLTAPNLHYLPHLGIAPSAGGWSPQPGGRHHNSVSRASAL